MSPPTSTDQYETMKAALSVPAHMVAHQSVGADVDAVAHFEPHVVVAELLVVLAARLPIGYIHSDVFSLLQAHTHTHTHEHTHWEDVGNQFHNFY